MMIKKNAIFFICIVFITNYSCARRSSPPSAKKDDLIFLVSIPKSGTSLLEKCLKNLSNKRTFYSGPKNSITQENVHIDTNKFFLVSHHSVCTEKELAFVSHNKMLGFFIYRDPRDMIISLIYYVKKNPSNPLHDDFKDKTIDELIYVCIDMLPFVYLNRIAWMTSPSVYTTTFERLVGSRGGGSDELQFQELKNIAHALKLELTDEQLQEKAQKLFGGTWNFREGKIGGWKKHFNDQHKEYFKAHANQLLIDLGYEKDENW